MKYGYARVSTKAQAKDGNSLLHQESLLREAGAERIFKDVITGKNLDRPQLNELIRTVKKGDSIIITKLDRFARSIGQTSEIITRLIDNGIRVEVLNIGVLDNTSVSTLFRNMLLSFAQFERDMIVERTQEGKEIARRSPNYREGRPRIPKARLDHAMDLLNTKSYNQVAEDTGISKSTLLREKKRRSKVWPST